MQCCRPANDQEELEEPLLRPEMQVISQEPGPLMTQFTSFDPRDTFSSSSYSTTLDLDKPLSNSINNPQPRQNKPKAVFYYPNWSIYARKYNPKDIPLDYVDHIIYGFVDLQLRSTVSGFYVPWFGDEYADVQKMFTDPSEGVLPLDGSKEENGPLPYYGIVGQLKKMKAIKPSLKVGISIAGATMSTHMSDVCLTKESRAAFVMGSVALLKQYDVFDEFDIDWEYISPEGSNYGAPGNIVRGVDGANFALLLQDLRKAFDAAEKDLGRRVTITVAVTGVAVNMSPLKITDYIPYVDEWRLMTYEYLSSAWAPTLAGHHTNLYSKDPYAKNSVDLVTRAYLKAGVDPSKIYIGVACHSRGFANTDGLGKMSDGLVHNSSWDPGVSDYKDFPLAGAPEYWDDDCKATYSYDPNLRDLNSYESVRSVQEKCKYVKANGLGGVVVWEITGDFRDPTNARSLTGEIKRQFS